MSDIFISYSSKDKEKADQLSEQLASAGLSVWIDRQGIIGAEKWATEIVEGIKSCSTFILLLSSNSIESENVLRELSLASEKRKRVLPVDIEPTVIPSSFEYPLAGLQRVAFTDFDKIIDAHKHGVSRIINKDTRKSLMILPFEDLSPAADNEWLANGIVSELISALSNVKVLRLADNQMTKEFKMYNGLLTTYAREMDIRYFVQGDVRKFGDAIKINSRLLDIESGDHLWQDSHKGTMEDIFDIQENVAKKVVDGLHIILTNEEAKNITRKPTANSEAYELYLRGREYFDRMTKKDWDHTLSLYEEAVRLDPLFAVAHGAIAITCTQSYRSYSHSPELLLRAKTAAQKVLELEGETAQYFWVMSQIMLIQGDGEGALRFAKKAIDADPDHHAGYEVLGFAYQALGMKEESVRARIETLSRTKNHRSNYINLLISLNELGDKERLREVAKEAIPIFERHVRLNPDEYNAQVQLVSILSWVPDYEKAISLADKLLNVPGLDAIALYNLACTYLHCSAPKQGMKVLRLAVENGFGNMETLRQDPDLDPLRNTEEFQQLMKTLEDKQNA